MGWIGKASSQAGFSECEGNLSVDNAVGWSTIAWDQESTVFAVREGEGNSMAKVVKCRDVGVDCDFEARGETEQEVLKQCAEHASTAHGMDVLSPDLAAKVKGAIHEEEKAA